MLFIETVTFIHTSHIKLVLDFLLVSFLLKLPTWLQRQDSLNRVWVFAFQGLHESLPLYKAKTSMILLLGRFHAFYITFKRNLTSVSSLHEIGKTNPFTLAALNRQTDWHNSINSRQNSRIFSSMYEIEESFILCDTLGLLNCINLHSANYEIELDMWNLYAMHWKNVRMFRSLAISACFL